MLLGTYIAFTGEISYRGVHSHISLTGAFLSLFYAVILRLWGPSVPSRLDVVQCWLHQVGSILFGVGLFMFLGGHGPAGFFAFVTVTGALVVLFAAVLMLIIFHKTRGQ